MSIYQLFREFKTRPISPEDIRKLNQLMKDANLQTISLWRMSASMRLLFATAKYQAVAIIFAGLLWIPSTLYQKYQEDNSKLFRICIYSPIAVAFIFMPLILYRKASKKILSEINYNLQTNQIQILNWGGKDLRLISPSRVKLTLNPKKDRVIHEFYELKDIQERTKDLQNEYKNKFLVEGFGDWDSPELLKYIIEQKDIRKDLLV